MIPSLLARPAAASAAVLLALGTHAVGLAAEQSVEAGKLAIFDGEPKLVIVNGYSTSFQWPDVLQRKLDRYAGGKSPIRVEKAVAGGTPIAKWIDLPTGQPQQVWLKTLRPMLQRSPGVPKIVLCQQSLQWVYGEREAGIAGPDDAAAIGKGADALQTYAELLKKDGADLVVIAMHIYKHAMEPAIGNERLALAEYLQRKPLRVEAGPDVWTPTKAVYPWGFQADGKHPGTPGIEIMAHYWFATLLEREGLAVPAWSREEMEAAVTR